MPLARARAHVLDSGGTVQLGIVRAHWHKCSLRDSQSLHSTRSKLQFDSPHVQYITHVEYSHTTLLYAYAMSTQCARNKVIAEQ